MANDSPPRLAVVRERPAADVAAPLRDVLRGRLADPALDFAEPPSPILGGFDTAIFAFRLAAGDPTWCAPLILRLFANAGDAERAAYEAAVQSAVASLGYPAPAVLLAERDAASLGAPFIIMRRLEGRPMLDLLLGTAMRRMARLLGEQHAALHDLDPAQLLRATAGTADPRRLGGVEQFLAWFEEAVVTARLDGLRPALDWLAARRPPPPSRASICHGDFHPLNLLVSGGEVTGVVDWAWAGVGPAEFDVGATIALIMHGPVAVPAPLLPVVRVARRWIVGQYLAAYRARRPLDDVALRYFEALRLCGFVTEAAEQMQAEASGPVLHADMQSPFYPRHIREGALRRLRAITGVDARLPSSGGQGRR